MNTSTVSGEANRLAYFPISIFSVVMGMTGLSIAWLRAYGIFEPARLIGTSIAALATLLFIGLSCLYATKLIQHRDHVIAEWRHPVRVNFFPTFSISLLLLSVAWKDIVPSIAFLVWAFGALIQLGFTMAILSSWMYHSHYEIKHANPAWFIPVVGNLFVPINAPLFGYAEIGWFYFSIGFVFWVVLLTIVLYRVFFHDPIPARLLPTLFILIAPPAVGFIAYCALTPGLDAFGRVLYYTALFTTALLAVNVLRFARNGFFISAWAYSFPLAAITIATFLIGGRSGIVLFSRLGLCLLCVLSALVILLSAKTINAARRHAICVPE